MARPFVLVALTVWLLSLPARASELTLPTEARMLAEQISGADSYDLAIGPYSDGDLPSITVEGQIAQRSWRIPGRATTLQQMVPLRAQLNEQDYDLLFECHEAKCGGFDFRFAIDVFADPNMHVDLFDYRYLVARQAGSLGPSYIALLISRTASAGFVQVTEIIPLNATPLTVRPDGPAPTDEPSDDASLAPVPSSLPMKEQFETAGRVTLSDLAFPTGSSRLDDGSYQSLEKLAEFLLSDPGRRVVLVGHTDSTGSLATNIALSKRRAASVVERLVSRQKVPRNQISAEGIGYLAPMMSNLTQSGREANRRVEAVLLNVE